MEYINSLIIDDGVVMKREKASLVNVNDSFKKIIVVSDIINVRRDEDGIAIMSIYSAHD